MSQSLSFAESPAAFRARARRVLGLASPIIGGMLSQNLLNLVDTAMVGQLGSAALGAVGFGGLVNWLLAAFFMGMGAAVQAIAARRVGEGNHSGALAPLHLALIISGVILVPYSILLSQATPWMFGLLSDDPQVIVAGVPYLMIRLWSMPFAVANRVFRGYWNGIGLSSVYMRTLFVIHALNIVLNWLLIYGKLGCPRLGVSGAAIASATATAVGTLVYAALAWRLRRADGFFSKRGMGGTTIGGLLRLSIPAGASDLFLSAGFVAFYRIAQMVGTRELAATNVLINLVLVCLLPASGFGLAASTLVGQSLGADRQDSARTWVRTTLTVTIGVMCVLGVILAFGAPLWLDLLMNDPEAERLAVLPLILVGCMQPFDAIGLVLTHALIGAGAVRSVMIGSILLQWGVFLPLAYLAAVVFDGGLLSLFLAMGVWRALFSLTMGTLYRRGGWARIAV